MKLIYNSFACFTYNLYFCSHYIISVYNKNKDIPQTFSIFRELINYN